MKMDPDKFVSTIDGLSFRKGSNRYSGFKDNSCKISLQVIEQNVMPEFY